MAPKNTKRGLGKGLDALIAPAPASKKKVEADNEEGQVVIVNITKVEPNRDQPRKTFDEDKLLELSDSIKQHGIINPLIVQDRKDHYEIIGGERRWRAAKKAGLKEVPVIIKNLTEQEIAEYALIDNIQRDDLNPIDEAFAYKKLIDDFGYTQDVVAEKVSKSRVAITNSLRLLKLCEEVRQMVIDGKLSTGHARALISIENKEEQLKIAEQIFDQKMSVRDTEKLVKNLGKEPKKKKEINKLNSSVESAYRELEEKCTQAIGTKVSISPKGDGTGKIEIEFYSTDDLEKITEKLYR
ncbi:ParB/RepB/Spo0J family partition protein [Butyrivibrio sp. INlla16]|uniref:ParB/RepB/Spo0J family partition protein n=1 Tax=Butyrivibrio sp. INlla16 TaxID=1520807 RepID=UPI000888A021|nr:ParB/RepB/Spo0J family partition protein [Butyrivibrio sp. INlla16]SDB65584.1 chromosome partitioning protein, ParB family [Butyrivibrio sp. INlla16]